MLVSSLELAAMVTLWEQLDIKSSFSDVQWYVFVPVWRQKPKGSETGEVWEILCSEDDNSA